MSEPVRDAACRPKKCGLVLNADDVVGTAVVGTASRERGMWWALPLKFSMPMRRYPAEARRSLGFQLEEL